LKLSDRLRSPNNVAPLIDECHGNLECKVVDARLVKRYNVLGQPDRSVQYLPPSGTTASSESDAREAADILRAAT
jgi:hypothetical protein